MVHPESMQRLEKLASFRLTQRDIRILDTIHAFDGMMSLKQIDRLFFSGFGRTQPRARMRKLLVHGFVDAPSPEDKHRVPFGETIFWLGRSGAEIVASMHGEPYRMFSWRKHPRWSWIAHDLNVNDFRIMVMEQCATSKHLRLLTWLPESNFLAEPDTVEFITSSGRSKKRQIRPDAFFTVESVGKSGKKRKFTFLLEIDMASHSNPRFAREKVRAGIAYLKTQQFQQRFGLRFARWLVVTTGERRLVNLMSATERAGGGSLFYFTTFARLINSNILSDPIWLQFGNSQLTAIIPDANLCTP